MSKNERQIKVSPSILAGDFGKIYDEAKRIEDSGANSLHIDVMDGHFVPNLTIGPQVVAAINRATDMFLDVHLMMYNVYEYIERFVEAGADRITFHFEATEDVKDTLDYIRRCNIEAGLAFCPETSQSFIPKYLDSCDSILLMTVHPGFGGQKFMSEVLEKIAFTREICEKLNIRKGGVTPKNKDDPANNLPVFNIGVDGGINYETAKECVKAGANQLIAGTYLLHSHDMKEEVRKLQQLVP
ncbi:ribulose-phosphate 3-epimerase [Criblamydia sequanensis]|uniref:Ribulose-phosphate 3-epimerase n=1 Tax=Candidatus Criblamydia sequanensis CRIB-18 TaxID=1437425 RepID=A0A090CZ66_9BACT|nr:ribulose-phosphate 3-epimerase [Criblamydia sequanensis]CDR34046.1 Ribulose-phosphate 3-epimerase [Criblamydia sequanensis CRIB-18]